MSVKRFLLSPFVILIAMVSVITIASIGGCPVAQEPATVQEEEEQQQQQLENNQSELNRPIPPPPTDDDSGLGSGGSSGGDGLPGSGDGGDGGGGTGGTGVQPIGISITAPESSNIYTAPGGNGAMTYEVFGGATDDGPINVEIFYDLDGLAETGDEVVLIKDLSIRGTETFSVAGIQPGNYYLGIYAHNTQTAKTAYAGGRLVVVGEPAIAFVQPIADVRVRPDMGVATSFNIDSLAPNVAYSVFTDTDDEVNGNETPAFAGGGLAGAGTILTTGFGSGDHFIGVTVTDSVGHSITEYFVDGAGDLISITVDQAPGLAVNEPSTASIVAPGALVPVNIDVSDPEGNADVEIFYDIDGSYNGNEGVFASRHLNQAADTYDVMFDTTGLSPAIYRVGAAIDDGAGSPLAAYAAGSVRVTGPPSVIVTITEPDAWQFLRPDPNVPLAVQFSVADPEEALAEDGAKIVLYEADEYGVPVGDPIWESTERFNAGIHSYDFDTSLLDGFIDPADGYGVFVIGVIAEEISAETVSADAPGGIFADNYIPEVISFLPDESLVRDGIGEVDVTIRTNDTSPRFVQVYLDEDTDFDGNEYPIIDEIVWTGGEVDSTVTLDLTALKDEIGSGTYYFYMFVSDGVDPAVEEYATGVDPITSFRIRDRLIGTFQLEDLTDSDDGAILQGFNFNDLAGSSMSKLGDMNGDGADEFVIVSRFGKPFIINQDGIGFGEAYMVFGDDDQRLRGAQTLNAVGRGDIPGVALSGIRMPMLTTWTEGISDITVVPDMDGDDQPEMVFSFPRVESLTLGAPAWVDNPQIPGITPMQHPDLIADVNGMGAYEYDAIDYNGESFFTGESQFTRGGVVIVSSHNAMLGSPDVVNRKFDRVLDLHEVGQMFNFMTPAALTEYIRVIDELDPGCANCEPELPAGCNCAEDDNPDNDCTSGCGDCGGDPNNPDETPYSSYEIYWDVWLGGG